MRVNVSKKQKGSAMTMVLIVSMLLAITAGVISIAVMGSTKALASTVESNDLFYSAESGLEYGKAKFYNNISSILGEIQAVNSKKSYKVPEAISGGIKDVTVTFTRKTDKKIEIKSEAIDSDNRAKEIVMNLEDKGSDSKNFPESKEIYKNGLVASDYINVKLSGSATLNNTSFMVGSQYTQNVSGSATSPKLVKKKYDSPIFVESFKKVSTISTPGNIDNISALKRMSTTLAPTGGTAVDNGIGYFSFKDGHNSFDVFLVNTDVVDINLGKFPLNANKFLIITNGGINFVSNVNQTIMFTNWSTIFAKDINITGLGSININSQMFSGDAYGISEAGIKKLDDIIGKYILNWNKSSSSGGDESNKDGWQIEGEIIY